MSAADPSIAPDSSEQQQDAAAASSEQQDAAFEEQLAAIPDPSAPRRRTRRSELPEFDAKQRSATRHLKAIITVEQLREFFGYDPGLGRIIRVKQFRRGPKVQDKMASSAGPGGYRTINFLNTRLQESYVVWAVVNGEFPVGRIKYLDGDKTNTRIENLVLMSDSTNTTADGERLPAGVQKMTNGRYRAHIYHGTKHHLGVFATAEEAGAAYQRAVLIVHDPKNHNRDGREILLEAGFVKPRKGVESLLTA